MNLSLNHLCIVAIAFIASFCPTVSAEQPKTEKEKIEALISHVEKLANATFIRNGNEYDAKVAARFLRGKWSSNDGEIKTAEDFIAKAATGSSTSGKPYMIRLKDGREVSCADYLKGELRKLSAGAQANP